MRSRYLNGRKTARRHARLAAPGARYGGRRLVGRRRWVDDRSKRRRHQVQRLGWQATQRRQPYHTRAQGGNRAREKPACVACVACRRRFQTRAVRGQADPERKPRRYSADGAPATAWAEEKKLALAVIFRGVERRLDGG